MGRIREDGAKIIFFTASCISVAAVILIFLFLFTNGSDLIKLTGITDFIFGKKWMPDENLFGIFPMIIGSMCISAGSVIIAAPVGIACAAFINEYCPYRFYRAFKSVINVMAGIPSIIYGFFALNVIVPQISYLSGGSGKGMITASITLAIMILPTIINFSEESIRSCINDYREASFALGANREQNLVMIVIPAAKGGIISGIMLGMGRALGETMAITMVCGNQNVLPESIFSGVRTLTTNIALEMGYASGNHQNALIASALILFLMTMLINFVIIISERKSLG